MRQPVPFEEVAGARREHVARDEQESSPHRTVPKRLVELLAIKLRHFHVADHQIVTFLTHALQRFAHLRAGEPLAWGRTAIGFANAEEDFAANAFWSMILLSHDKHVMP